MPTEEELEFRRKLWASLDSDARLKVFGTHPGDKYSISSGGQPVYDALWKEEGSRKLTKVQKLFDITAEGGAAHGGPAISGGGTTGIGYAPQRDITKTFPGAMSKEEEEYQKILRARVGPSPGLFKW